MEEQAKHLNTDAREHRATLRYLHIAPRKVRLLADSLKGLPASEAEAQLLLRPHRASRPLVKLLRSAVANAKTNKKANPDALFVASVRVDKGPILKRSLPRAMGRATPIHKIMSHVTIVLAERSEFRKSRFVIQPPEKKKKAERKKSTTPKPKAEFKAERPNERGGFFKRMFRRKAV